MRNCVFDGNTASTFFIGSVDIRRHLSVLVEPTKPILAAPFLCSVSHLNEYFSCSHSYIENCSCVFPQPDGWRSRWLLLFPTKATSVPLSPASGYHDLPCYFGFYGNHLFSEASDLFRPSLLLSCNLEVPSPPSFCQRLQGAFLTRVAGRVAVAHWLVSFTSSGGPLQFFFSFWRVGVSFYQKASSLQVRAEWDIPKSRDHWPPWRGADSQDEWISSPPTVASPIYC